MKKYAIVTEYGDIVDSKLVKAVRNGTMSIYEAFNTENGTRNGDFSECLYTDFNEAMEDLYFRRVTVAEVFKNANYFLDCSVCYCEEREYDDDGEYNLAECENVWAIAPEIIK